MLRFNENGKDYIVNSESFKYISCYGSTYIFFKLITYSLFDLNTSHVTVQLPILLAGLCGLRDLNTSHVTVQLLDELASKGITG